MTKYCEECGKEMDKEDEADLCEDCQCSAVYGVCLFCNEPLEAHEGYICDDCLAKEDDEEVDTGDGEI